MLFLHMTLITLLYIYIKYNSNNHLHHHNTPIHKISHLLRNTLYTYPIQMMKIIFPCQNKNNVTLDKFLVPFTQPLYMSGIRLPGAANALCHKYNRDNWTTPSLYTYILRGLNDTPPFLGQNCSILLKNCLLCRQFFNNGESRELFHWSWEKGGGKW